MNTIVNGIKEVALIGRPLFCISSNGGSLPTDRESTPHYGEEHINHIN